MLSVNGALAVDVLLEGWAFDLWCVNLPQAFDVTPASNNPTLTSMTSSHQVLGDTIDLKTSGTARLVSGSWCFSYTGTAQRFYESQPPTPVTGTASTTFTYSADFRPAPEHQLHGANASAAADVIVRRMRNAARAALIAGVLAVAPGLLITSFAQDQDPAPRPAVERLDADIMWKIRREATERSQIMRTLHVLTDVYGPRLTGSPNLRRAQDWLVQQATAAGLKNAHLEDWGFGSPGWLNEKTAVHIVSPVKDSLVVEALAWTPGTNGTVTASTVIITPPERPTQKDADTFFARLRGNLKGRAVMVGQPAKLDVTIDPPAKRRDDNEARAQFSPTPPPSPFGAPAGRARPPRPIRSSRRSPRISSQEQLNSSS